MKVYYVKVKALGENKYHIVTAKDEDHAKSLVNEFWFNDSEAELCEIKEVDDFGVQLTKHETE